MKRKHQPEAGNLRQQAEYLLSTYPDMAHIADATDADILKLIHELQVHQIELELQNDELIRAKEQADLETEKFTALYDFAPSGYFAISSQGIILELNLTGARMLGKNRSQIKNHRIGIFISDETKPEFNRFLEKVFTTKTNETCEVTLVTNDNLPVYVQFSGIAAGQGEQCFLTMTDVTRIKTEQESLHQSEEKYSKAFHTSPYAMILSRVVDGKIIEVNEAFTAISGYSREEAMNDSAIRLNLWTNAEDRNRMLQLLMESNEITGKEFQFNIKSGETRSGLFSAQIIQIKNEKCILSSIDDITQRKHVEKALKESEALYRTILHSSPDDITIANLEGRILMVSHEACSMFGYSRIEEIVGRHINEFIAPDKQDEAMKIVAMMFHGGQTKAIESQGIRSDGSIFDIEVNAEFIRDTEGNPTGLIFIVRDLTERKQAEKAMQESEKKFRNIFETMQDTYYEASPDGTLLEVSPSIITLSKGQYTREEMLGKSFVGIYADPDARNSFFTALSKQGSVTDYELMLQNKDGSVIPCAVSSRLLFDAEGKFVKISGTIRDVSERKRAGEALRESEEKYRLLFYNNPQPMWIYDVETLDFLEVNQAAITHYGYTREEFLSMTLKDIRPAEDIPALVKDVELSKNNQNSQAVWTHFKKNKELILIEITAQSLIFNGKSARHALITDVTERKQAEEALRVSSQKWEAIVAASPDGIGMVSLDGKLQLVSDKLAMMYGYTSLEKDDFMGKSVFDFIDPSNHKMLIENVQNLRSGMIQNKMTEYLAIKKDQSRFYAELNSTVLYDSEGKPANILYVQRDITDRKKAEEELRKFKTITDQANYGAAIASQDGTLVYVNKSMADMHGWDKEELIGKSIMTFHSDEHLPNIGKLLERLINEGGFAAEEVWHVKKDGMPFPTLMNTSVIYDNQNVPQYTSATVTDITDRFASEKALKQSEENLNYAQEIAGMGSWEFNLITGKYTWSKNNYLLAGMQPFEKEVTIDFFFNMVHPDDVFLVNEKVDEVQRNKKAVTFEFRMVRPDGQVIWLQNNIVPLIDGDQVVAISGVIFDVTEKRIIEEKIQQQNERLNAIIQANPDMIFVIDEKGTYHEVYASSPDQLLSSVENIIGSNISNIFGIEEAQRHLYQIDKCILEKKLITFEYDFVVNNRTEFFEARLVPFASSQVLALIRNITDKKKIENEIRELNSNLEQKIQQRTAELAATNANLTIEVEARKVIEQALDHEKNRLDDIIKGTNAGTWVWNVQTDETIFNDSWAKIIGYTLAEISPVSIETWRNFSHPQDLKKSDELLENHFTGGSDYYSCESRMKHKNGEWVWVLDRGKVHEWDEFGKPVLMSGTHLDITERKKAEEALLWNKTLLELMSNSSPLGFLVVDNRTDDILYFNHRFCQIWEIEQIEDQMFRGELKNNDIIPYCLPVLADIPAFAESCKPLQSEGNRIVLEDEIPFTDHRTVRRFSTQIRCENDEYYGRFYIFEDITGRKQAEKALKTSEELLNEMTGHVPGVVYQFYARPNGDLGFYFVSEMSNQILGINPDIDGFLERIIDLILPEYKLGFGESILKSVREASEWKFEGKMQKPTGEIIWFAGNSTPSHANGELIFNGIVTDISQRKQDEETLLKAKSEAEKANQAKSEFLSRMSHELRTPMNSILGFAQLMDMGELNTRQKKGVNYILSSGRYLLKLIDEVLDISRIEAGKLELAIEPVNLVQIINEITDSIQPQIIERQLTLEFENQPADQFYAEADNQRLKQVLLNLMSNAIKYNPIGGLVRIKTRKMPINEAGITPLRISITNTGEAISAENIQKLFEPFERIGAEKTETTGSGLGLTVVKKLMDAMHGAIGVESIPGVGNTFWIELPSVAFHLNHQAKTNGIVNYPSDLAGANKESGIQSENEHTVGNPELEKPLSILYIEDNIPGIELVEGIMGTYRPKIKLITNMYGENAVKLAIDYKPALILLDLDLPGIHGSEVLDNLKADVQTSAIPVVIVSADAMPDKVEKLSLGGASDYLTKPIDIVAFLKVVDEWTDKSK